MFSVMIVDDESIIRRGIRNCIPWEEHDMEIIAEAASGQEALDLALCLKPDIVIADICMPEIDGLEMSERLLAINPGVKIIILTGYDEFEYAQRAVRLGVVDFMLKPTNADDLLAILDKTKKLICSERNSGIRLAELESRLKENIPLIRENYLIRLISGVYTSKEINEGQEILNIKDNSGSFQVAILDYNSTEEDSELAGHMEMLHFAVKNLCSDAVDRENLGWTFYNERGQITLLLYFQNDLMHSSKIASELLEAIQQAVNRTLKASFSIGSGRRYERIKDVKRSYDEAKEALEYRFVMGENSLVFIDDVSKGIQYPAWDDLVRVEKEIISGINKGNEEIVIALIEHYFEKLKKRSGISPLWAKAKCYELAGNVILAFGDSGLGDVLRAKYLDELYGEIYRCNSLPKAVNMVENFVREVLKAVSAARNTRMRKLIEMGKEYINEHYSEEISVAEIAEHLFVTPNYFSRVFKKETGEGCVEYINRVRMEKAKELLRNTLNLTYEVADRVGFRDANYFSLAFKKYTGFSPTEYRDSFNK